MRTGRFKKKRLTDGKGYRDYWSFYLSFFSLLNCWLILAAGKKKAYRRISKRSIHSVTLVENCLNCITTRVLLLKPPQAHIFLGCLFKGTVYYSIKNTYLLPGNLVTNSILRNQLLNYYCYNTHAIGWWKM